MNILLITTHFPPKRGGVESSNLQYLDFFENQKNFHLTVLTYDNRSFEPFNDYWKNSTIIRVKVPISLLEFMTGLKSVSTLNSFLKKLMYAFFHVYYLIKGSIIHFKKIYKADIILANGALIESIVCYFLSTITRKKYLVRWRTDLSGLMANIATRLCLNKAMMVIVNGQDIKYKIAELTGLGDKRVLISKHAIDTKIFHPIPQTKARMILNLPQRRFIILFAAALNKTKFCDVVLNSAPKLFQRDSDMFLVLIGEGPLEPVARLLAKLYSSNVLFIDRFVEPEKLNLYVNAADIVISCADIYYPSRMLLESLACGTPVYVFSIARCEEKNKGELKLKIPLSNVFTVSASIKEFCAFLIMNKSKIRRIRNNTQLIKTSRQYILQKHERNKVIEEEVMHFIQSIKNLD